MAALWPRRHRIHTCIHTYIQTCIHTVTYIQNYVHTLTYIQLRTYSYVLPYIHVQCRKPEFRCYLEFSGSVYSSSTVVFFVDFGVFCVCFALFY